MYIYYYVYLLQAGYLYYCSIMYTHISMDIHIHIHLLYYLGHYYQMSRSDRAIHLFILKGSSYRPCFLPVLLHPQY